MALKRDFSQMLMNARSKWVNVFKTAYFFGQGPSCRPATHTKKNQSTMAGPQMYEVSSRKGCGKQIHDLLTGVGFSLRQFVFVHLVYFYQDCTMILGTCFNYFLATLRLQEQNNVFFGWNALHSQGFDGCMNGSPRGHAFLWQRPSWRNQLHVHKMGPRTGLRCCL